MRLLGIPFLTFALTAAVPWVGRGMSRGPSRGQVGTGAVSTPRWNLLDLALVAWLGVEVLAAALSTDRLLSLSGEPYQREGLHTSLGLAGLYVAARCSIRSPRDVERLLDLWLAAVAAASVYALLQAAGMDPLRWARTADMGLGGPARPFGTLGHPNLLGVATSAACAAACARFVQSPGHRWIVGPAAALFAVTTLMTFSRAAWLALLVAVPVTVWAAVRATSVERPSRRLWLGVSLAAGIGLALLLAGGWGDFIAGRGQELASPSSGSAASRVGIWRGAIAAWQDRPLLGHGLDTFALVFPKYQPAEYWRHEWGGLPFHAHSVYLHTLATRGLAGFLAGAWWVVALVATLRRTASARLEFRMVLPALTGGVIAHAVGGGFGAVGIAGASWLVVVSGTCAGLAATGGEPGRAWRMALPAAGLAALLVGTHVLDEARASRGTALARAWIRADPAAAAAHARAAARHDPLDDHSLRAGVEACETWARASSHPARALLEATGFARRAAALRPQRALNHRAVGRVLAERVVQGEDSLRALAVAAYRRSFALAPADGHALNELARFQLAWGEPARALGTARDALALYPDYGEARLAAGIALARIGRLAEARTELETASRGRWYGNPGERELTRLWLESLPVPMLGLPGQDTGAPR